MSRSVRLAVTGFLGIALAGALGVLGVARRLGRDLGGLDAAVHLRRADAFGHRRRLPRAR